MEACYGAFERHVPLPEKVDEGGIKAEYLDGVLEVVLPAAGKAIPPKKALPVPTVKAVRPAKVA